MAPEDDEDDTRRKQMSLGNTAEKAELIVLLEAGHKSRTLRKRHATS